jgi:hypothetical protein
MQWYPSATQQHGIVRMWTLMPVARQPVHLYPQFHFHIFVINIAKGIHTWRFMTSSVQYLCYIYDVKCAVLLLYLWRQVCSTFAIFMTSSVQYLCYIYDVKCAVLLLYLCVKCAVPLLCLWRQVCSTFAILITSSVYSFCYINDENVEMKMRI